MERKDLVSIITPVLNAQETVETTINSIVNQSYEHIEYIIVDGGSTDRTLAIINDYKNKINKVFLEKRKGIYVSINTGLSAASGNIIGILNSDDFYADNDIIESVVCKLVDDNIDSCWGDLEYVDKKNTEKIIRYWRSSEASPEKFRAGWMPPHPTFFVKRWVYEKYGFFKTDFKVAADYEILLRFLYKYKISSFYLPRVLVRMRTGGLSNQNIKTIIKKSREDYKICQLYDLNFLTLLNKNLSKVRQFIFHY